MSSNSEDSKGSDPNKQEKKRTTKPKRKKANEKNKKSRKTSWVWEHFTTYNKDLTTINEHGEEIKCGHTRRAVCKYCKSDLNGNTNQNGTTTLQRHIELHCDAYPGSNKNVIEGQKHLVTNLEGKDVVVSHWSQENCLSAAVEMIVIDELPFSTVEKQGFRRFCAVAVPKWQIPCRKVVVKRFLSMYNEKREILKAELSSHRISLTTDTWTSIQNINYMVLTAHFIDSSWTMHKRVLNFCVIPNHQGSTIGKIIEQCLHEWSIKNVLTISVDNASANKVALDYVRKKLNSGDKQLLLDGKYLHVRCLAHIVNLIVKSGLKCMEKSVVSIRNAVRYVRSSPSRLNAFKECVKKDELESKKVCVLDVPTRWNSTFIMLDTAIELKPSFDRLADEEDMKFKGYFDEEEENDDDDEDTQQESKGRKRVGPPNDDDWERATIFVKFLRIFFDSTLSISATNKPTAHKAFQEIVAIKCEIEALHNKPLTEDSDETDKVLFDMGRRMRKKFLSYFDSIDNINQLFLVALVLDPRFKLRYFERVLEKMMGFGFDEVNSRSMQLKTLIVKLTDLYAPSNNTQSSTMTKGMTGYSSENR